MIRPAAGGDAGRFRLEATSRRRIGCAAGPAGGPPADTGNPPEENLRRQAVGIIGAGPASGGSQARPGGEAKPPAKAGPPAPAGPKKIPPPDAAAGRMAEQKSTTVTDGTSPTLNSKEEKLRLVDRLVRDADDIAGIRRADR